jgi:hypothetical protein
MRAAIAINGSLFNTHRMLSQYIANAYHHIPEYRDVFRGTVNRLAARYRGPVGVLLRVTQWEVLRSPAAL